MSPNQPYAVVRTSVPLDHINLKPNSHKIKGKYYKIKHVNQTILIRQTCVYLLKKVGNVWIVLWWLVELKPDSLYGVMILTHNDVGGGHMVKTGVKQSMNEQKK